MNPLATCLRPGNGPRNGSTQVDRREALRLHDPRPSRAETSRDCRPVAPVAFLEPGPSRTARAPQCRRADQDEETLRPLRTPFTADEPGGR